jgi:hypothetical protein
MPGPTDNGRVAYVTTDGGTTAPPTRHHPPRALLCVELNHPAQPVACVDES